MPYLSLNSHFLLTLQAKVAVTYYACQVNYNSIGQNFTKFSSDPLGKAIHQHIQQQAASIISHCRRH